MSDWRHLQDLLRLSTTMACSHPTTCCIAVAVKPASALPQQVRYLESAVVSRASSC
jgi:hypothetical protein